MAEVLASKYALWAGDAEKFLGALPLSPTFDLVVTSPPYNIGKSYEEKSSLEDYLNWQTRIISEIVPRVKNTGNICWQVGNYVENGHIAPLDIELVPIFRKFDLVLRNRIIWHYGHGMHNKRRFSGRYEVVLWFTKNTEDYTFNLDEVRIPSKYPGKRHFKGPKAGQLSGNPRGKNPEDVWNIPNVKNAHLEKTDHPCQFPIGLIEKLVLCLSNKNDLVFDPFAGVATTGAASALHGRSFWGCEKTQAYIDTGKTRILSALAGTLQYRPHDKPLYDHTRSKLSLTPNEWKDGGIDRT
jgi:adenine-specific DNA-methyltransferase